MLHRLPTHNLVLPHRPPRNPRLNLLRSLPFINPVVPLLQPIIDLSHIAKPRNRTRLPSPLHRTHKHRLKLRPLQIIPQLLRPLPSMLGQRNIRAARMRPTQTPLRLPMPHQPQLRRSHPVPSGFLFPTPYTLFPAFILQRWTSSSPPPTSRKATSLAPSPNSSPASTPAKKIKSSSASQAPARPSPWPKSSKNSSAPPSSSRTTRPSPPSSTTSSKPSSPTTQSSTSSPTTTTTNPKPTSPPAISSLKRSQPSQKHWINFASPPLAASSNDATPSSSAPSPASTASAPPKPTTAC